MENRLRTGIGCDAHPLVKGRRLIVGGVEIPFDRGLEGWSDGDALTHAVIDALLGAAALGDIGRHFPPGEPEYKDISSLALLAKTKVKLDEVGFRIVNIDATVIADQPAMRDFIPRMCRQLSQALDISTDQINVKASSGNGLGFAGRGEGIAACAVALLERSNDEGI